MFSHIGRFLGVAEWVIDVLGKCPSSCFSTKNENYFVVVINRLVEVRLIKLICLETKQCYSLINLKQQSNSDNSIGMKD